MEGVGWLLVAMGVLAVIILGARALASRNLISMEDGESVSGFPYQKRDQFLTAAERSFYGLLKELADTNGWDLFAKVRLEDLVEVKKGTDKLQAHRNRIKSRHIDFLICDSQTVSPIIAIELNDATHARSDRQQRDIFVSGTLEAAGLPLLVIPAQRGYDIVGISRMILERIGIAYTPDIPTLEQPLVEGDSPSEAVVSMCPRCGSQLVERQSRKTGDRFLGCANYPSCHHTELLIPSIPTQ